MQVNTHEYTVFENQVNRIVCISTPFEYIETVMFGGEFRMTITHQLDVLGFYCPVPLHETKKALQSLSNGDVIGVKADDPETLHDIPMYLGRTEHVLREIVRESGEFYFIIEVNK
mgnify:CR=1 FL=1